MHGEGEGERQREREREGEGEGGVNISSRIGLHPFITKTIRVLLICREIPQGPNLATPTS